MNVFVVTYLTKLANQGVMYSKHKCFSSIVDPLNPCKNIAD